MQKTENKTTNSVRSKLVAAIAMLLVATIMVVSSTYAWFTLSTKPEVSGISTAVGANGALEMLLATKDADGQWVYGTGEVGGLTAAQRNTHWGNLVDLSLEEYGSGLITLYPSRLSITPGEGLGKLNVDSPIETPKYGADGRVEEVEPGGMFALYDADKTVFLEKADNYGFRAIGIASGLTARQQAFRVAVAQILVNSASAQTKARAALNENGNALASIAIKKAMVDGATYDSNDTSAVQSMITGVTEALAKIEDAYVEIICAAILGKESGFADESATMAATAAKNAATSATGALGAKVTAALGTLNGLNANVSEADLTSYDIFTAAVDKVTQAQTKFNAIGDKSNCTWTELSPALYPLVDVENIKINGYIPTEVKNNTDKIVQDVLGGKGINVVMSSGAGVFADIADYTGDYTVGIVINTGDLNLGVDAGPVDATMKADATSDKSILSAAKDALNAKAPDGNSGANPITEFYGYAVDLAFRTNASTSNLLLQTAPADRIYGDNQNEETMGKGSTMTFATTDTTFNQEKMLGLMGKLKVVFYDTKTNDILAYAKLDTNPDNVTGSPTDGLTANLYIEGKDADGNPTLLKDAGKGEIVALSPGLEQHVTVLVYLDGDNISNADVSAIAEDAKSMSGTFNIQFASSADLVPMEYSDLHTAAPAANNP